MGTVTEPLSCEVPTERHSRRIVRVLLWGVAAALVFNLAFIAWTVLRPAPWAPLLPQQPQDVVLPDEALAGPPVTGTSSAAAVGPVLHITSDARWPDVPIAARKCSTETVQVVGSLYWQSVEPPGTSSTPRDGQALRLEGCTDSTYANPVPDEVKDRVRQMATEGRTRTVWKVAGIEVPIRPGERGVEQPWSTENFVISWEAGTS